VSPAVAEMAPPQQVVAMDDAVAVAMDDVVARSYEI
jgi:hypothetical protein